MNTPKKITVLIVDDSASVRQVLREIIESDPEIEVLATAADPYVAVERIRRSGSGRHHAGYRNAPHGRPDLPRKDHGPAPHSRGDLLDPDRSGSDTALAALEKGAVEIIAKPKLGARDFLKSRRVRICDVVKSAARARLSKQSAHVMAVNPKLRRTLFCRSRRRMP